MTGKEKKKRIVIPVEIRLPPQKPLEIPLLDQVDRHTEEIGTSLSRAEQALAEGDLKFAWGWVKKAGDGATEAAKKFKAAVVKHVKKKDPPAAAGHGAHPAAAAHAHAEPTTVKIEFPQEYMHRMERFIDVMENLFRALTAVAGADASDPETAEDPDTQPPEDAGGTNKTVAPAPPIQPPINAQYFVLRSH